VRLIFLLFVLPSFALAECPSVPDRSAALERLSERAHSAGNDMEGRQISGEMWKIWLEAPDAAAQAILEQGMARRESFDFLGALSSFDRLVAYCPHYAEGFNQRAFVHFLTRHYGKALVDLDAALALNPGHVGALSGRALTLLELGRLDEARDQLNEALAINPWLSERFLLQKGGPLAVPGDDI
jgi:tetratricopeptide (TPR) repeat protein